MKQKSKFSLMLAWAIALGGMHACTSDSGLYPQAQEDKQEGDIALSFTGTAPTRSTTTTISPEEANTFLVTVRQGEAEYMTIIRGPQTLGTMDMRFPVGGGYSVYAESCTEADAELNNNRWGQKRFVGTSDFFSINKGETTKVRVPMSVENASLCVIIQPSLSNYFKTSCTITLSEVDRGLVWTYDNAGKVVDGVTTDGQIAYFNLGEEGTRTIAYTITAVSGNNSITKEGTVTLSRAKNSRLNLAYQSGFFTLNITVDESNLYVGNDLTFGPEDVIQDDGETDAIGNNDEFNIDDSEVDYDQYN